MNPPLAPQALVTAAQLGQLLKARRKSRGLTQAAIASRLNLSQNRVSYLELHPEDLSFKQLIAWCAAVDLELRVGERNRAGEASSQGEW